MAIATRPSSGSQNGLGGHPKIANVGHEKSGQRKQYFPSPHDRLLLLAGARVKASLWLADRYMPAASWPGPPKTTIEMRGSARTAVGSIAERNSSNLWSMP